ncbi:MAG: fatty acid kinase fatty acid binding subunit [Thermoleophilaceae bacterium]|nr:fatty acid kinase fatty acid binding subunit [Thermoleophilaceae bacterium]
MAVAVVTDTTSYLPGDLAEANQIHLVSLYVVFGGERTVREADITDYDAFFEELRGTEQLPTTSQPSVGDFMAVWEPLLERGDGVVSIHISGGISGTVQSAQQAAEQLEREGKGGDRVRVIDSATSAGGLGLVALAAARAAARGASLDEVVTAANEARASLKMWFAIDTLEFLRRSGRIGAASAWLGSTLKIKPILTLESEMAPVERVRTSKRAFERMVDYARQRHSSGMNGWVVQHIQAPDQAAALADRCREIFGHDAVFTSEIGPVLGAHTGPGLLGVGSIDESLL